MSLGLTDPVTFGQSLLNVFINESAPCLCAIFDKKTKTWQLFAQSCQGGDIKATKLAQKSLFDQLKSFLISEKALPSLVEIKPEEKQSLENKCTSPSTPEIVLSVPENSKDRFKPISAIDENSELNTQVNVILALFNQRIQNSSKNVIDERFYRTTLASFLEWHMTTHFNEGGQEPTIMREGRKRVLKPRSSIQPVPRADPPPYARELSPPRLSRPSKNRDRSPSPNRGSPKKSTSPRPPSPIRFTPRIDTPRSAAIKQLRKEKVPEPFGPLAEHWFDVLHKIKKNKEEKNAWKASFTGKELEDLKEVNLWDQPCFPPLLEEMMARRLNEPLNEDVLSEDIDRNLNHIKVIKDKVNASSQGTSIGKKQKFAAVLTDLYRLDKELKELNHTEFLQERNSEKFAFVCKKFLKELKNDKLRSLLAVLTQFTYTGPLGYVKRIITPIPITESNDSLVQEYSLSDGTIQFLVSIVSYLSDDPRTFPNSGFSFPHFELELINKLSLGEGKWSSTLEIRLNNISKEAKEKIRNAVISPLKNAGFKEVQTELLNTILLQ